MGAKNSIKVNKRKIFAVVISLWLVALGLLLGVFFSVDNERQNAIAAPAGWGPLCIAVQVNGLDLSDELYAELKAAKWDKITEDCYVDDSYSESYGNTIVYTVGEYSNFGVKTISTTSLDLPITILEKSGKQIKLSSTFGGNTYEYTSESNVMSGYVSSDFPLVGSYNYAGELFALLVTISIEEPNQLNFTIGFDNLGFVDTSLVLYVFNNDTNEILYTNAVVISGTENTLNLTMDKSVTAARITLAVPYLWQITWVGADSYINKSAIVNLSANTTISAKINIIDGYNNIIII